jgi:S1-C subfamily serine protease
MSPDGAEILFCFGSTNMPRLRRWNSGGTLVDEHGNVVGVVSARLGVEIGKALTSDEFPENVNYAVKSSLLLSFLESVSEVSTKLKEPVTVDTKFEDVVKSAQDAAVLVLVY